MEILQEILFWGLSFVALLCGVVMITNRTPIYSVLSLVVNFFCIGGLFLLLNAEFLAVVQIIVYAGAIMVLFLFVVMLLNLRNEEKSELLDWKKGIAFILGLGFLAEMLIALRGVKEFNAVAKESFTYGKVEPIGRALMTEYLFPFEMISVILLAALIGAVVIAKKHKGATN